MPGVTKYRLRLVQPPGAQPPELIALPGSGQAKHAASATLQRLRLASSWPFDTNSAWNYPIGDGAIYENIVGDSWNLGTIGTWFHSNNWTIAMYVATGSDPLRTITVTNKAWLHYDVTDPDFFTFEAGSYPKTYQVRVPAGAVPSPDTDGYLCIVDPDGIRVHEFYATSGPDGSGNYSAYQYFIQHIKQDGLGWNGRHGTIEIGTSAIGGLVRAGELLDGIPHALGLTCGSGQVLNQTRWPCGDPNAGGPGASTTGNIKWGSLLAIPYSVDIDAEPWVSTGTTLTKVKNLSLIHI